MRLAQFISRAGWCSRRAASRLIDQGRVSVNGQVAGHLSFVQGNELVIVENQTLTLPSHYRYVMYNKPVGIDCNCSPNDPASISNQLDLSPRLFPVGRLDKDSHGLLLLTNDGDFCHQLLAPEFNHPKVYQVTVEPFYGHNDIGRAFVEQMTGGIALKQGLTKPCQVTIVARNQFEITLTQGLNRQIRKMAQACGYRVVNLQRVSMAGVVLGELALDSYQDLTQQQLFTINQQLGDDA